MRHTQLHALVVRDLINQTKTSAGAELLHSRHGLNETARAWRAAILRDQDNEKSNSTILTTRKNSIGRGCPQRPHIVLTASEHHDRDQAQITDAARGCLTAKRTSRSTTLCGRTIISTIRKLMASRWHQNHQWSGEGESRNLSIASGARRRCWRTRDMGAGNAGRRTVKLADGARSIQHMMATSFWHRGRHADVGAAVYEMLFGRLPEFFCQRGRAACAVEHPETPRHQLLDGWRQKRFCEQLAEMQRDRRRKAAICPMCSLYVAFAAEPKTRTERADFARRRWLVRDFGEKQRAFITPVLGSVKRQ